MAALSIAKAAILGATGPTGIHLADALARREIPVRVVSRTRQNLISTFGNAANEKTQADIMNKNEARRAIEGCDVVFDCIGLPPDQMHNHPVTAHNIATAIGETGARCVQVSSFWSYLPNVRLPLDENHPRTDGSIWMKYRREAEDVLQEAGAAIAHLPDFYGPYVQASSLQTPLKDAVAGKAMNWIGSSQTLREYIYVPDAMSMVADLAGQEEAYGKRWILPGGGPLSGQVAAEWAGRILGVDVAIRPAGRTLLWVVSRFNKELRAFMQMVPEYLKPLSYDASRLEALIGKPQITSYEDGFRATIKWLQEQAES
jgi:nucleoside-diphosphate-sugar epimerase